jgi:hypothetical protein
MQAALVAPGQGQCGGMCRGEHVDAAIVLLQIGDGLVQPGLGFVDVGGFAACFGQQAAGHGLERAVGAGRLPFAEHFDLPIQRDRLGHLSSVEQAVAQGQPGITRADLAICTLHDVQRQPRHAFGIVEAPAFQAGRGTDAQQGAAPDVVVVVQRGGLRRDPVRALRILRDLSNRPRSMATRTT